MLKSDLVQTDKHSTSNLLQTKNLRFLRRTNHIKKPLSIKSKSKIQING